MKKCILIFLMSIPAFGFTFTTLLTTVRIENLIPHHEKRPFLTSYIVEDQLYLNIPEQVLDKPLLFVRYDHIKERKYLQVVWALHKDKILLKVQSINSSAGIILPFKTKFTLKDNILAVFPFEKSDNKVDGFTINITDLILKQVIEWIPGFTETIVPQITLLKDTRNLEDEVIVKTRRGLILDQSKISVPIFFGFSALGKPMKARRYDYRMGFYNELTTNINFGTENRIANITRWRLEKKYKERKISAPIKPIIFLMSLEIPKKWRPYVKAGIEEWLPAFESAGFRDALVVKEADSLNEWEAHSIKTSLVYWGQKKYLRGSENEDFGGTISKIIDLRSGEILRGDIHMGASSQTLQERYFIRAAPLDPRTRKFPFPDELIGKMYQELAAHEAGHVFGLMDGNYGEYSYPFDKMNDSLWLQTMGYSPSIMNYTRSNNIPQPADSIPPSLLLQKVGPTDEYSIKWAYTEFPEGTLPKEEGTALEYIIRLQDSIPWYRYNNSQLEVIGPASSNEVVEANDAIRSTEMALKNIKRVIELLPEVNRDQKDNARLERLYSKVLELWYHQMIHVVSLIGGYEIHYKSINQPGNLYTTILWENQEEAIDFIIVNAFNPPDWLTHPEFEAKTRYSTFPDEIVGYQQRLILEMINAARMKRLEQLENNPSNQGSLKKYLTRLQAGLFKELKESFGHVNPRNQEIQMTYIDRLIGIIDKERLNFYPESKFSDYTDYSKGLMMQQLMFLKKNIEQGIKKNNKAGTLGHWQLCLRKINTIN